MWTLLAFCYFFCYDIQWIFDGTIIKLQKIELSIYVLKCDWRLQDAPQIKQKKKINEEKCNPATERDNSASQVNRVLMSAATQLTRAIALTGDIWRQTVVNEIQEIFISFFAIYSHLWLVHLKFKLKIVSFGEKYSTHVVWFMYPKSKNRSYQKPQCPMDNEFSTTYLHDLNQSMVRISSYRPDMSCNKWLFSSSFSCTLDSVSFWCIQRRSPLRVAASTESICVRPFLW